jgi:acyl-coenzyme A synthetase/AMP-(fatty) acid ligase
MLREIVDDLAPDPLLEAVEGFRGSFFDLDRSLVVEHHEFGSIGLDLESMVRKVGVASGDRIVMAIGNGPLFPALLAAILRVGGSPILVHADTPLAEIRRTAERFGAAFLVSDGLPQSDLEALRGREFSLAPWASGVCARIGDVHPFGGDGPSLAGVPLHPTSGTTGLPKLALRPGAAAVAEARHYVDTIGIDERDLILCTVPMSHAYGFGMCTMVPLLSGASVASTRRFTPAGALQALREHPVTVYPTAPFALDVLLAEGGDAMPPPPRCITSAGAPLPELTATHASRRWGTTVRPLFGTTETGGISVAGSDHDCNAAGSVGPPMNGVSIEVRDGADEGSDPGGDVGRLWVRSSSMMVGYLGNDEIDRSKIVDGWFDTGDMAFLDDAGNIRLRGRASEVINVFGMKVLPSEVEEVIALLPQIKEVKVYGVVNGVGYPSVRAAVVSAGGLREADVRAHCRAHLTSYKRPDKIVLLDVLPRNPSGKIALGELP